METTCHNPLCTLCALNLTYAIHHQLHRLLLCPVVVRTTQCAHECVHTPHSPWCASYNLRQRALYNDMSRYICCNGDCPCSGRMGEQSCPEFCLVMEVCCCFAQSVASTRWLLQDEMRIANTKCDNCIIGACTASEKYAHHESQGR